MRYWLVLAGAYLVGSIPFGLLFSSWWGKIDVRKYGSGNIGMTNVLRTVGYLPAFFTLLCDLGKGMGAVLVAQRVTADPFLIFLAGTAAVAGHNWPLFLNFKGGKGIATITGLLLAFRPLVALILIVIWLLIAFISRYISLASVLAAFIFPFLLLFFPVRWSERALAAVIAAFTLYKHRTNITRLRQGTEYRFGQRIKPQ